MPRVTARSLTAVTRTDRCGRTAPARSLPFSLCRQHLSLAPPFPVLSVSPDDGGGEEEGRRRAWGDSQRRGRCSLRGQQVARQRKFPDPALVWATDAGGPDVAGVPRGQGSGQMHPRGSRRRAPVGLLTWWRGVSYELF